MGLADIEREIIIEARKLLKNQRLRLKDLLEWSTAKVVVNEDEVVVQLPGIGVEAAFPKSCDKRG